MIGYHYTSGQCWERIKIQGLIPYPLHHPAIKEEPRIPRHGIWVYCNRQDPLSHEACLIWQAASKQTSEVVLIEVSYSEEDRRVPNSNLTVAADHDLAIAGGICHVREPAHLLFRYIGVDRLRLLEFHRDVPKKSFVPTLTSLAGRTEQDVAQAQQIHTSTWQRFANNPMMLRDL